MAEESGSTLPKLPKPPRPVDSSDGKIPRRIQLPWPRPSDADATEYRTMRATEKRNRLKIQYLDRVEQELRAFGSRIVRRTIQAAVVAALVVILFWSADWTLSGRWLQWIFIGLLLCIIREVCNFALIFRVRPDDLEGRDEGTSE